MVVSFQWWGVLRLLEEAGGELTVAELANRLLKDKPTLTRILDLLVGAQLVTREADPADRRRTKLRLTPQGQQRVERAAVLVEEMRREMGRGLTTQDRADLERILSKINENIEAARARPRR